MAYDRYVPAVRTVYSFNAAANALAWALQQAAGKMPSLDAQAVFMAKLRLESGNFAYCYNHNPGNIKHSSDPNAPGMLTLYPCNEVLPGRGVVWFSKVAELTGKNGTPVGKIYPEPPGHPQARFVANANPVAGFDHYVGFLRRERYRAAFEAAWTGDPAKFSHVLKVSGYYTADEAQYTSTLVKLYSESRAKLQGIPHEQVDLLPGMPGASYFDWLEWQQLRADIVGKSWERTQALIEETTRAERRMHMTGEESPADPERGSV
jgi:hypothetical protein